MSANPETTDISPVTTELEMVIAEANQEFDMKLKEAAAKAGVRIKTEIIVSLENDGQEGCEHGAD